MDLSQLNEEQRKAVVTTEGPLAIIAGAGSGKTKTMTTRAAYLVERGVAPERILLLTFTNKAADEMKVRASQMADARCKDIVACTYHSFCSQILRKYGYAISIPNDYVIITPTEAGEAIDFVKAQAGEKYKHLKGFPNNRTVISILSASVNKLKSIDDVIAEEYYACEAFIPEIKLLVKKYQEYKTDRKMLDYDDLLTKFVDLLESSDEMCDRISTAYQYMMVDEYQDTNKLQEKMVILMRKKNKNIAVVGDDAQGIYSFRGADIENILTFADKFPGCKVINLKTNYRSNDEIVQFANRIFNENKNRGFDKCMEGTYHVHYLPEIQTPENQKEEAVRILKYVQRLVRDGGRYQDVAVLARATTSFRFLETMLAANRIPYVKYGGIKFWENECIVDLVSYIRCIANPYDQLAWFRILKLLPGVGKRYASDISEDCMIQRDFLFTSRKIKKSFMHEAYLLGNEIERFSNMEFHKMVTEIIKYYTRLRQRLVDTAKVDDESNRTDMQEKLENDKEILKTAQELVVDYPDAQSFLDAIILDAVNTNSKEEDCLVLSTIHSAKGLEFDHVFVLDCVEDVFPRITNTSSENAIDEELRCMYVAITRPKKSLHVMCPQCVTFNGKPVWTDPSRFIQKVIDSNEISA